MSHGVAFRFSYCVKVAPLRFGPKVVDESLWDIRLWHGQPKTLLIAVMAGPRRHLASLRSLANRAKLHLYR